MLWAPALAGRVPELSMRLSGSEMPPPVSSSRWAVVFLNMAPKTFLPSALLRVQTKLACTRWLWNSAAVMPLQSPSSR